jgi:broad specificity phosphatase PhoE
MRRLSIPILALALFAAPDASEAQPSAIILVRHAEKANTPGPDPELSEDGMARAKALGEVLAHAGIDAVIATQYQRTSATASYVMSARRLTPIVVPASRDMAAHFKAVADAVRSRPAGETVLVVGHSNTIPGIIGALGGPKMEDLCDADYDNLFILEMEGDRPALIRARYGAPDDESSCTHQMQVRN